MPAPLASTEQLGLPVDTTPAPVGSRGNIFIGTCSWADASLIKSKRFYPRGCSSAEARLRFYASQFPIVEVDSSYFALPSIENSQRWAERTPDAFRFNVKAYRLFTGHHTPPQSLPLDIQDALGPLPKGKRHWHYADMPDEIRDELWRRFIEGLQPLREAGKLKAVHFQFAPWVTSAADWRRHVEECVDRMAGQLLSVEFRNQSWFGSEKGVERTLAWERDLGVAHVVVDEPQDVGNFVPTVWAVTNPALAVVRLHGRNAGTWNAKGLSASSERFDYEYTDEELDHLARRTAEAAENAIELAALVNVNFEDQGIRAARRLAEKLRRMNLGQVLQPPEAKAG